jgi:hypothetical protein
MVFHPKCACVVVWSLSGAKNGQEIGKTLNTARNGASQANRDSA